MRILKTINYIQLESLKELTKVKKVFCLPVLWEGISEEEVDKLDMENFIHVWKKNWDWYFTKKVDDERCEEFNDVYFSKVPLRDTLYDFWDYIIETDTYIYLKKMNYA